MAKVIAEFDTEDKSFKVSVNGKDIGDVDSVYMYKYKEYGEDEEKMSTTVYLSNKEDGVETSTQYYVRGTKEAIAAEKSEHKLDIPDFVGKVIKDPTKALAEFFTSKSRFR